MLELLSSCFLLLVSYYEDIKLRGNADSFSFLNEITFTLSYCHITVINLR